MRNQATKALFLSLAKESAESELEETSQVEPEDKESTGKLELLEEQTDMNNEMNMVGEALEATDDLNDLSLTVESFVKAGHGMTRVEASALRLATKAATRGFISNEVELLPSTEAYDESGSQETNKENTKAASKGLKNTIVSFIKAVIKKIQEYWGRFVSFFNKLKRQGMVLENKFQGLTKQLSGISDFRPVTVKVNVSFLNNGGKGEYSDIYQNVTNLEQLLGVYTESEFSPAKAAVVKKGFKAVKSSEEWTLFKDYFNNESKQFFGKLPEGAGSVRKANVVETLPIIGNSTLVYMPGSKSASLQLAVMQMKKEKQSPLTVDLTIESKEQLTQLINAGASILTKVKRILDDRSFVSSSEISSSTKELENLFRDAPEPDLKDRLTSWYHSFVSGHEIHTELLKLCMEVTEQLYALIVTVLKTLNQED